MPLFAEQTIQINAPAEKVWRALTDKELSKEWVPAFGMQGGYIESDWKDGSEVMWKDRDGKTQVNGKLFKHEPYNHLHFGVRDTSDPTATEQTEEDGIFYTLSEKDGVTTLHIKQGDFERDPAWVQYYEPTMRVWEKVLPIVKRLAEM